MSDISAKSSPRIKEDSKLVEEEEGRWMCSSCTFSNVIELERCEMCDAPANLSHKKVKVEKQPAPVIKSAPSVKAVDKDACPECTFVNKKTAMRCDMCGEVLKKDQLPATVVKPSRVLIKCTSCKFDNDPDNDRCVGCDKYLKAPPVRTVPSRAIRGGGRGRRVRPGAQPQVCPICSSQVAAFAFAAHYKDCEEGIKITEDSSYKSSLETEVCNYCDEKFSRKRVMDHIDECPKKVEFFQNQAVFGRMTPLQKNAIIFMHDNCQKQHFAAKPLLLKRIMKLGYKAKDLEALHHYLQNYAPIIVHIHVSRYMEFFVKDTHYRNQFQTRTSSGSLSHSARTGWENRMFSNRYSKATGFERVKYGTVNFTNDPKGVRACAGYGASYFLLKSTVRSRCTFTDMDSSSPSSTIATFKFSYHGLNKLSDAEIKAAIEAAKANEMSSSVIGAYKEIQIHGPIEFAKDIERIYVNKAELADPKRLEEVIEFSKKHKVDYEIFEPEVPVAIGAGLFGAGFGGWGAPAVASTAPPKIAPRYVGSAPVELPKPAPADKARPAPKLPAVLFGYEGDEQMYDEDGYDEYYEGDYYEE